MQWLNKNATTTKMKYTQNATGVMASGPRYLQREVPTGMTSSMPTVMQPAVMMMHKPRPNTK